MIRRRLRPAAPFAFLSLAVAVVMGAVLAAVLTSRVRARAEDATERLATSVAGAAVQPALHVDDLTGRPLGPQRVATLTVQLRPVLESGSVRHLDVLAPDRTIVWSDRAERIGRAAPETDEVVTAFDDRPVTRPLRAGSGSYRATLPLHLTGSQVDGALELDFDADAGDQAESGDQTLVMVVVALAMLLMWLLLVRLADRTTTDLRTSLSDNERRARTDALTGLPNRIAFAALVDRAVHGSGPVAVVSLDIDRFKDINDSFGHRAGDDVLRLVAGRLTEALPPGVAVARLGGDEFGCVSSGPLAEEELRHLVKGLPGLALLLGGARIEIAATAGMVRWDGTADAETLLQRADVALYAAKRRGVAVAAWEPSMAELTALRLEMLSDLRTAIADEELELYLQPAASPQTGRVTGAEVLLRWNHPEHGLLLPDAFVPLAEQNDLIHQLTRWTLERAVAVCKRWEDAGLDLTIAVNISPRDLTKGLPLEIAETLDRHGLAPGRLTIELTETCLPTSMEAARVTLAAIAALGVRIAVDDFGTGFATLTWLTELCFSELKVDRSFVAGLAQRDGSAELVRHVIALGHGLGMTVVAEGVETAEQWELLGTLGADVAQGFLVARPMPAAVFGPWLDAWDHGRIAAGLALHEGAGAPR